MQPKSDHGLTQRMAKLEADYRTLLLVLAASAAKVAQLERVRELSDVILNSPGQLDYPSAPLAASQNPMPKRTPCFE
jgi:hypothetical protein